MSGNLKSIAIAKGDGVGKEIMDAVLSIFNAAKIPLEYKFIEMGKEVFLAGNKLGMTKEAQDTVESLGVLFKGPMETPKGGGNRSINVVSRKMWSTYANCRVFRLLPGVETVFSKVGINVNLTIIRENLEDTYGGVEHLLTSDVAVGKRFASVPGAYAIHRYAFEYAKQQGIKSVTCGHKANIMKITDGIFLEIFYEVAKQYPDITASDIIVDDLCMKLVTNPALFELIVLPNLQGDIVSDLCAGLIGGLGFAPSGNIGNNISIFEAVHGTAPDIAGKNIANPTALLLSGIMMLNFLGFIKQSKKIEIALFETLRDRVHTADVKTGGTPVSTTEFANTIISKLPNIQDSHPLLQNLSQNTLNLSSGKEDTVKHTINKTHTSVITKGIDLSIECSTGDVDGIVATVKEILKTFDDLKLEVVSNRGTNVYPEFSKFTELVNVYTLRIVSSKEVSEQTLLDLSLKIHAKYKILALDFLKKFDEKPSYTII